jgi:hypothetical protein
VELTKWPRIHILNGVQYSTVLYIRYKIEQVAFVQRLKKADCVKFGEFSGERLSSQSASGIWGSIW